MTAFSTADIPASIDTVEKLAVWVGEVLSNINFQTSIHEVPSVEQPVAVSQKFVYDANGVKKWRYVSRVSIELSSDHQFGATKLWTHAQALSSTAIPTSFKS